MGIVTNVDQFRISAENLSRIEDLERQLVNALDTCDVYSTDNIHIEFETFSRNSLYLVISGNFDSMSDMTCALNIVLGTPKTKPHEALPYHSGIEREGFVCKPRPGEWVVSPIVRRGKTKAKLEYVKHSLPNEDTWGWLHIEVSAFKVPGYLVAGYETEEQVIARKEREKKRVYQKPVLIGPAELSVCQPIEESEDG